MLLKGKPGLDSQRGCSKASAVNTFCCFRLMGECSWRKHGRQYQVHTRYYIFCVAGLLKGVVAPVGKSGARKSLILRSM